MGARKVKDVVSEMWWRAMFFTSQQRALILQSRTEHVPDIWIANNVPMLSQELKDRAVQWWRSLSQWHQDKLLERYHVGRHGYPLHIDRLWVLETNPDY